MNNDAFNRPTLPVPDDNQAAANLIRNKLDKLYSSEPDAVTEAIKSYQTPAPARSKHQQFMLQLAQSGKPFAEIQKEWHDYYNSLSNREKHEVWEEFYATRNHKQPAAFQTASAPQPSFHHAPSQPHGSFFGSFEPDPAPKNHVARTHPAHTVADLKKQIVSRVKTRNKLSRKQNLKSIGFGLGVGTLFLLITMFGFFNERIIAPFIAPSRNISSTPIIMDPEAEVVGTENKLIIPKINVEVPIVYDVLTVEEQAVQEGLERGVVHYATTSNPGERGNGAIFGHSSNNILNKGKYKFAFVLLSRLEAGDTFYIEKDGQRYVYRIFDKKVVSPTEVSVLNDIPGKVSTMALITCDPPGTTINRLVVWGEQISPDPNKNTESTAIKTDATATQLAGNPQSLWSRIWNSVF